MRAERRYSGRETVVGWWAELPTGRVVRLVGADPDALALSLEPLPEDSPAVVVYRPRPARSAPEAIARMVDELENVAVDLFPLWLPGAERIAGPGSTGLAAVRALATARAAASTHFGDFLADLAGRALAGRGRLAGRYPMEIRASGLARVVAESFGRAHAALLVHPVNATAVPALAAAGEWLAHRAGAGVWLAGLSWPGNGRIGTVHVRLPDPPTTVGAAPATNPPPVMSYPPIRGKPHPNSEVERLLEEALSRCAWATGRAWNETYQPHPLAMRYVVDLMWAAERCAIEIDGPEHRTTVKVEADRRRDDELRRNGYRVERFTNDRIQHDLDGVIARLERIILDLRHEKLGR